MRPLALASRDRLARHAAGDLQPTVGEARRSHTLRVGRYAQHFVDALQMDENPVEYLLRKYPQARTRAHPAACQRAARAKRMDAGGAVWHLSPMPLRVLLQRACSRVDAQHAAGGFPVSSMKLCLCDPAENKCAS